MHDNGGLAVLSAFTPILILGVKCGSINLSADLGGGIGGNVLREGWTHSSSSLPQFSVLFFLGLLQCSMQVEW